MTDTVERLRELAALITCGTKLESPDDVRLVEAADEIERLRREVEELKEAMRQIIVISDRDHVAWNRGKELLDE